MGIYVGISFFVLLTIGCLKGALNESISSPFEFNDPPVHDGPVLVALGIYVLGFLEINEKRMDYTVMMYYRESWKDTRVSPSKGSIMVHRNDLKKFWFPDIFLRNEKFAATHNVMTENRLLRISHDGKLWHVRKISVTLACPMNFFKFPFDTQSCPLTFESFAYTMDTLILSWLEAPAQVDPSVNLPEYTLTNYHLYDCSQYYTTDAYPCQEIHFSFKRDVGSYVVEFFLPTIFLVVMALLTFWIDLRSTTHRIAVSSIALIFICVLHGKIRDYLPIVSYLTAADVWATICIVQVLFTIIVHIVVNFMLKVSQEQPNLNADDEKMTLENPDKLQKKTKLVDDLKAFILGDRLLKVKDVDKYKRNAELVNALSRLVLAVVFILITVAYFTFYTG